MKTLIFCILALFSFFYSYGWGSEKPHLIEWGQSTPDARLLSKHYEHWEEYLPFDGLVIPVNKRQFAGRYGTTHALAIPVEDWPISSVTFSGEEQFYKDYEHAVLDLKNTPFKRFKHNFIHLELFCPKGGYQMQWFNEKLWEKILKNVRIVAEIAYKSGCAGIMFDTEEYAGSIYWSYAKLSQIFSKDPGALAEYNQKVRERGTEFIKAINEVFPNCQLILSFGSSAVYVDVAVKGQVLQEASRYLLAPFVDGLLLGAHPEAKIIDGNEPSYYFRTEEEFIAGRGIVKNFCKDFSAIPNFFSKKIGLSFGLYPTHPSHYAHTRRATPQQLERALFYALKHTDKYVWIWSEKESYYIQNGVPSIIPDQAYSDTSGQPGSGANLLSPLFSPISPDYIKALFDGKKAVK